MVQRLLTISLLLGILGWVGCGDGGGATTAKVDGTVTLDGSPLPNADIAFNPTGKSGGRPPTGKSDTSGKFQLSSFKPKDGAMPGSYLVTVDGQGVPDKYKRPDTTDLKATVEAGKSNPVKLELKKGE